jgi:hypothetical protein
MVFVLLFMVSDFSPLYCLSFYLWFLTFPHCIVCPSIYDFWLFPIVLFVFLLMVSDFSPLYCSQYNGEKSEIINRRTDNTMGKSQKLSPLYCLSFYLSFLIFLHWIVWPSIYGFWLFPIVLSVLLFMVSDFSPLYCLSFYLWFLTFLHCIVCPSIYDFSLCPIIFSVLLFMVSDFSPLYCLSFYLWFLTFPHCIVCPSIYGFWLFIQWGKVRNHK